MCKTKSRKLLSVRIQMDHDFLLVREPVFPVGTSQKEILVIYSSESFLPGPGISAFRRPHLIVIFSILKGSERHRSYLLNQSKFFVNAGQTIVLPVLRCTLQSGA